MKIKLLSLFVVIILIFFGFGFSVCSILSESKDTYVIVYSDTRVGKAPLKVSFSYKIYNLDEKVDSFLWNFNDGEISTQPNVTHVFYRKGIFNVSLKIHDKSGNILSDSIEIHSIEYYKPIAFATANNTYGKKPLKIQFNSECYDIDDENYTCIWNFDDGSKSTKLNPKHEFKESGIYNVHLTVFDKNNQEDTHSIQINVVENYPPIAKATADIEPGKAPLTVKFQGSCEDPDGNHATYHWHFENTLLKRNDESNEQNPTHQFKTPGTYIVKLTVKDEEGLNHSDIIKIVVKDSLLFSLFERFVKNQVEQIFNGSLSYFLGENISKIIAKFATLFMFQIIQS